MWPFQSKSHLSSSPSNWCKTGVRTPPVVKTHAPSTLPMTSSVSGLCWTSFPPPSDWCGVVSIVEQRQRFCFVIGKLLLSKWLSVHWLDCDSCVCGGGGGVFLISLLCLIHFICDIKWILVYFAVWLRLFFRLCSLVLFEEVPRLT